MSNPSVIGPLQSGDPISVTGYESGTAVANTAVTITAPTPPAGLVNSIGGISFGYSATPTAPQLVTIIDNSTGVNITAFQTYATAAGTITVPFQPPKRNNTGSPGVPSAATAAQLGASASITNVAVVANVATIAATNTFAVGQFVTITGLTHTALNGTFQITAATGSTFQFAVTTANIASASDTGTATAACTLVATLPAGGSGVIGTLNFTTTWQEQ
jgi:hypothetical protein